MANETFFFLFIENEAIYRLKKRRDRLLGPVSLHKVYSYTKVTKGNHSV